MRIENFKILAKKQKYYVVWEGNTPGIYMSWEDCQLQIKGHPTAKYKSFDSLAEAEFAQKRNYYEFVKKSVKTVSNSNESKENILKDSISVDAACSGNPGKGGYGILMRVPEKKYQKTFSEGFRLTTNNRMELLAVIEALEKLKNPEENVHVFTDSKYVADAINQNWIFGWIKKGFKNVKNPDLWQRFIPLFRKHKIEFHWIKGHAGHPENEICDQLAVKASQSSNLKIDAFFENQKEGGLF